MDIKFKGHILIYYYLNYISCDIVLVYKYNFSDIYDQLLLTYLVPKTCVYEQKLIVMALLLSNDRWYILETHHFDFNINIISDMSIVYNIGTIRESDI